MCSIGEDDFGDDGGLHTMQNDFINNLKIETNDNNGICHKCNKSEIAVKINFREAECKECFFMYVRHKFRATLGSSKILSKNADVLVVIDGSPESIVLLDVLYYALKQDNFKKLRCQARILYVDNIFLEQKRNTTENLTIEQFKSILDNYSDLELYFVSLTASIDQEPMKYEEYIKLKQSIITDEEEFMKILDNIRSLTSKQDFIMKTRKKLIYSTAKYLKSKFIFLSDISTDLATAFLTNISLGAGASVASDVSLIDNRYSDIKIIRPIKDLTDTEISNYIQLNNLKYLNVTKYGDENKLNSSIQNLTKEFVKNLQENFPSTVSTVFRTGDKITNRSFTKETGIEECLKNDCEPAKLENVNTRKCNFCNSEIDCENSDTLRAIKFSKLISTGTIKNCENLDEIDLEKTSVEEVENTQMNNLCHTCRNIFQDFSCKELFKFS